MFNTIAMTLKQGLQLLFSIVIISYALPATAQNKATSSIESWITNADRSALFVKQPTPIVFERQTKGRGLPIIIDDRQKFQTIDGFGFALTWGSTLHLHNMSPAARKAVMNEIFSVDTGAGVSYLRLTIGASDLNSFVYSYDDLPAGQTDPELKKFNLGHDYDHVIPVLKEILSINPQIKLMASPWSAPAWMKTNNNVRNGSLKPEYYNTYAQYFVKYIQAMKKEGITIDAITIQNEPLNAKNTPSMPMRDHEQATFIKQSLGPAFKAAGIATKIILFDHNLDRPDYPLSIMNDPEISDYVDGSAFHHYGGEISTMSLVHLARPDKNLYFTEQMVVEDPASTTINIATQVKRLVIGTMRNWSRNLILWNLAADKLNDPHTDNGGCSMCQGAITIDKDEVKRNIAYYTIAHASKFVRSGSVRISSTSPTDKALSLTNDEERPEVARATVIENSNVMPNVAFRTPDGKIVLIVANDGPGASSVKIQYKGMFASLPLKAGAVGSFVWKE